MIDWMVECMSIYKKKDETFFHAAYLFDYFLENSEYIIDDTGVHCLGVTCMLISAKYTEVHHIPLAEL